MSRRVGRLGIVFGALALGCGARAELEEIDAGPGAGGGGGGAGGPVVVGGDGGPIGNFFKQDVPAAPPRMVTPDPFATDGACGGQTIRAERLPLDLYLMMDSSGSMEELIRGGMSKWNATKAALISFFNDAQSAGLGIGLQYFPLIRPGVPDSCAAETACGNFGPCMRLRGCTGTNPVKRCDTNAQCAAGQTCALLGICQRTPEFVCFPSQNRNCGNPQNPCVEISGYCIGRDMCEAPSYATPAVAVAALPGAAGALTTSLNMRMPDGLTPTAAALTGAIDQARMRARANPARRVAVVLATDGLPTTCMPTDITAIAGIAQMAARGTPAVPTFVIGVFAPAEQMLATTNLNAIATAGGTPRAYVINTDQNVTQLFQTALNEIRTSALSCEYKVPAAMGAADYGKVNVTFTGGNGQMTTIGHVKDKASCHPTAGGWYYDVDPTTGTPMSIIVCDNTCTTFKADSRGRVDIVLGCKTFVIE